MAEGGENLASGVINRSLPQAFLDAQFKPGQSGNQLGRKLETHTLAAYVRSHSLEGTELVDFLLNVMKGTVSPFTKIGDRLKAVEMLLERGWGKAPQVIALEGGENKPTLDLSSLSDSKFRRVKELLEMVSDELEGAETASQEGQGPTISPPSDPQQGGK